MPRRNGNGATSQYVLPVCFESLGSFLDFHPTRPNTYALFPWVGERVLAPGTSTDSTATTFAGMNYVDAHLHDNLGLLSSRLWRPEEEHTWLRSSTLLPSNVTRSSPLSTSRNVAWPTLMTLLTFCLVFHFNGLDSNTAQALAEIRVSSQHILKSVQLSIGSFERESPCLLDAKAHAFELSSPCQLLPLEPLYLQVRFRGLFRAASKSKIPLDELLRLSTLEWSKSFDKFNVVLKFSQYAGAEPPTSGDLRPTTDELFKLVERFRVLVIGKVALLYLYSQVLAHDRGSFRSWRVKYQYSDYSQRKRKICSTRQSGVREHGEGENFQKVVDFLKARKKMSNVRDQVHAVWLCFPVSLSKGDRLFEAGVEELFRMKSNGDLGPVSVITVFTKYDKLVEQVEYGNNLEFHKRNKHLDRETRNARLAEETAAQFQELCVGPFEKVVGIVIPHIAVSTNEEYKVTRKMLNELVHLTADCVKNTLAVDVAEDVALVSAIAQRVNPAVKIDAGWEEAYESSGVPLGESYWMGLAASVNFPGKTIEECLRVLHTDIVEVWNIQDGCGYLESKELKKLMFELVGNQYDEPSDPNTIFPHAYSLLGALTMLIGGLTAPAAPIVIPIVASLLLAKWIFDVYKALMLQRLMAYIVDFTIIMQIIFGLVVNARLRLSRRLIKLIFKAYSISDERSKVHKEIKEHVKLAGRFDQDAALAKIIQLIKEYQMKPEIMEELQSAVKAFENNEDEDWGVGKA
ncbi:uncharacterized protein LACBIDRAFT_293727 [Laccaria bicolor S238N-H82]|uniref:Predicted protein n=1 Tax=Laccaria bicolor (strain S238N-H82 / ATCC MYA-4686) TaxID=486041 RepID=B0D5W3_LACBS|nr:uncharacterized protein LACBIDRAFT_293727 [Laccaria bicolor S238N-H82]EDR09841.1 predicted protein [Laccaria bicolor S238N-H82]|eukprot:XP_001879226.1 predicted protein [Laccaria bicolor S238N-H82]